MKKKGGCAEYGNFPVENCYLANSHKDYLLAFGPYLLHPDFQDSATLVYVPTRSLGSGPSIRPAGSSQPQHFFAVGCIFADFAIALIFFNL